MATRQRNLAVIGAGPKAAAITAKAYCLQQQGYAISVTVFERNEIGAAWTGSHGYTDGLQRLCTPIERDLGFPYLETFGHEVVERMQAVFSWAAFKVAAAGIDSSYSEWVNRGRRPPTHSEFARYISFAFERAGVAPVNAHVTRLEKERGRWLIHVRPNWGKTVSYPGFDGVVFTGPGKASSLFPKVADKRIFTGVDFWTRLAEVRKRLEMVDRPIVIIGGGGTAAAITAWFVRSGLADQPIILLNNQAMLFTRTTNFFESSLFDDEDTWLALALADRSAFTKRLNRGVVWETVTDILTEAPKLTLTPGKADEIVHKIVPGAHEPHVIVRYTNALGTSELDAGIIVDATGFATWDFTEMLPPGLASTMKSQAQRDDLTGQMRPDLSLPVNDWPRLHTPNLSESVGPGYLSLMVLGAIADRVLRSYV